MREIKFRAWDKRNSMMFVNIQTGIHFDDGSHYGFSDFLTESDRWTLMQYTGLKDKNGKEVYEGDVVKQRCPIESEREENYEVSLRDFFFRVEHFDLIRSDVEVIGNIYENKEMLNN